MQIQNMSDAAVYLPRSKEEAITIPRAVRSVINDPKTGDSRTETKYTPVTVDDSYIDELRKNNKVVAGLFTRKVLKVVGSGPPPETAASGGKAK